VGENLGQDPHMIDRAKRLRNASTPFESKLWRHLNRSQLDGHKFRRQHVIGNCITDFFCPQKGLIVEVDGDTHSASRDARRDAINAHLGYDTIRFSNADVGKNIEGVLDAILQRLQSLPDRWPHPCPSPEGEGK
jgi:very-short-patch-repair endonuclease